MSREGSAGRLGRLRSVTLARIAIVVAVIGVFLTWTQDEPVSLTGVQGPNNGWIVVLVGLLALAWTPALARGSWTGVVAVLGTAVAMAWTAIESWLDARAVQGASAGLGLVVTVAASVVLVAVAVAFSPPLERRAARPGT